MLLNMKQNPNMDAHPLFSGDVHSSKKTNNRGFEQHKDVNCYFLQKVVLFLQQPDETLQVKLCT